MDGIINNNYSTPVKAKTNNLLKDSYESNVSCTSSQISPSNTSNSSLKIGGDNQFTKTHVLVTSTPVNRPSKIDSKKSCMKSKRLSIKSDNETKRVDITSIVKTLEEDMEENDNFFNSIYMDHLKFKYSRLDRINKELNGNEANVYTYCAFFNSEVLTSKFVYKSPCPHLSVVEHRYDSDKYVLKIGAKAEQRILSQSSQKIIHEIRILKLLGYHPHIVEYCDSWMETEQMYLQLRFVSGGSLYDHLGGKEPVLMSEQSVAILTAHMSSVLIYLHEYIGVAHLNICLKHILIELVGYTKDIDTQESVYSRCQGALIQGDRCLRFKLCDFSTCGMVYPQNCTKSTIISGLDIWAFGLVLFQCFGGILSVNHEIENWDQIYEKMSEFWRHIITNLSRVESEARWTARTLVNIESIRVHVVSETTRYFSKRTNPVQFLEPFSYKDVPVWDLSHDKYCITSQNNNQQVDITKEMQVVESRRVFKENTLNEIHDKTMKFRDNRLGRCEEPNNGRGRTIYLYPFIYNSKVMFSKFATLTTISDTKLSRIFMACHRFDGSTCIVKVGKISLTAALSDSSREIVSEMRTLKNVGRHPHVVDFQDCWIENECFHLQLGFISGGSLYDFLQGHVNRFHVLSDIGLSVQRRTMCSEASLVLLAHMASVLVFLHNELDMYHGDIKPSNILVELTDREDDVLYQDDPKRYCHDMLAEGPVDVGLRFKLCDFGRSGSTVNIYTADEGDGRYLSNLSERCDSVNHHKVATARDIFSLGVTIFECLGGFSNKFTVNDIRDGSPWEWPDSLSLEWRYIIQNMCHVDLDERWTANTIISLSSIQPLLLPETLYHIRTSDQYINCSRDAALSSQIDISPALASFPFSPDIAIPMLTFDD